MKTFKQFHAEVKKVKKSKKRKDFDQSMYIHGEHARTGDKNDQIKEGLFGWMKNKISPPKPTLPTSEHQKWIKTQENNHLGDNHDTQMQKLQDDHKISNEHLPGIKRYTDDSFDASHHLINAHNNNTPVNKHLNGHNLEHVEKSFQPSKHEFSSFTGVGSDPRKFKTLKTVNGTEIKHMPAHFSSSLNKETATKFAEHNINSETGTPEKHIIHWHIKKGDPISAIGSHSTRGSGKYGEHEVLLPRTTPELGNYHAAHTHTEEQNHGNTKVFIHHFNLHKPE